MTARVAPEQQGREGHQHSGHGGGTCRKEGVVNWTVQCWLVRIHGHKGSCCVHTVKIFKSLLYLGIKFCSI